MSANVSFGQNSRFKIGWNFLLVSAVLMTLSHLGVIFFLDNPTLFEGFAAFNLYAFLVIYIPFRRGEKWAWYTTWILPIGLAALAASRGSDIAIFYYSNRKIPPYPLWRDRIGSATSRMPEREGA